MLIAVPPVFTDDGRRLWAARTGDGPLDVVVPNGAAWVEDLAPLWRTRTVLTYDLRNRGASDADAGGRGIPGDVDDLDAVRRGAAIEHMTIVAHSYVGVLALAYAMARPARVGRLVLIGAPGYGIGLGTPPPPDAVAREVFQAVGAVLRSLAGAAAQVRCEAVWRELARVFVAAPEHAARIRWGRCDLANERAFSACWSTVVEPSLQRLAFTASDLARVSCPVLVVHGDLDRSAAPTAGRAWAARLPDARLLAVPGVAHAPWLEAPDVVLPAIAAFLDGRWPDAALQVREDL